MLDSEDFITARTRAIRASGRAGSARGENSGNSCYVDVFETTVCVVMSGIAAGEDRRETPASIFALNLPGLLPDEAEV